MVDPVQNPYISPDASTDPSGDPNGSFNMSLSGFARTGQIITFALIQGVIIIAAIFYFLIYQAPKAGDQPDNSNFIFVVMGAAMGLAALFIGFLLPIVMRKVAINKYRATETEPQNPMSSSELVMTYPMQSLLKGSFAATLVGQAVMEGAAVINLIFMILDDSLLHFGIVAVLVIGIAVQVPTEGKLWSFAKSATEST